MTYGTAGSPVEGGLGGVRLRLSSLGLIGTDASNPLDKIETFALEPRRTYQKICRRVSSGRT